MFGYLEQHSKVVSKLENNTNDLPEHRILPK